MDYELFVSNDLIDMYAESGDMKDWVARMFFWQYGSDGFDFMELYNQSLRAEWAAA